MDAINKQPSKVYDVAVIGAGVAGALIARELTKYNVSVALLEKNDDVATETTKANSAIVHAGFDAVEGSLKAELNVKGCMLMQKLAEELYVPFIRNGSLVCAFTDKEINHLHTLLKRGKANGVKNLEIVYSEKLFKIEPNLSRKVKAALYAPDSGIICPYEFTVAAAENAIINGADLISEFKVTMIKETENNISVKSEKGREVKAKYVINSAGLYSDEIAAMCGDIGGSEANFAPVIIPRRGEYLLLDRKAGNIVRQTLFSVPSEQGKGVLVSPTVDGNLILGPNAMQVEKNDTSTTKNGLQEIETSAKRLVDNINMRLVITSFAGVRATPSNHDFNIKFSVNIKNALHLIGIESPGLASSPAIATYVVEQLKKSGLHLTENANFNPKREKSKPFREMTDEERATAVKANPLYAKVICRCETVTEAEITDTIKSHCPAVNIDAIKRRTRAGMGRCQGGFCSPRIVEILSRELGTDMTKITKKGGKSYILTGRTK